LLYQVYERRSSSGLYFYFMILFDFKTIFLPKGGFPNVLWLLEQMGKWKKND